MMRFLNKIIAVLSLAGLCACVSSAQVRQYRVKVQQQYPHDVTSFTQGLFFDEGQLYESTGLYGMSTFRKVELLPTKYSPSSLCIKTASDSPRSEQVEKRTSTRATVKTALSAAAMTAMSSAAAMPVRMSTFFFIRISLPEAKRARARSLPRAF